VVGKGDKERRVPMDPEVARLVQTYLLVGRPETDSQALFVVAMGNNRCGPLTPAGLRTVFRYHRARAGVPALALASWPIPDALRHAVSASLTTPALNRRSMRWFEASPCRAARRVYLHLRHSYAQVSRTRLHRLLPLALAAHDHELRVTRRASTMTRGS